MVMSKSVVRLLVSAIAYIALCILPRPVIGQSPVAPISSDPDPITMTGVGCVGNGILAPTSTGSLQLQIVDGNGNPAVLSTGTGMQVTMSTATEAITNGGFASLTIPNPANTSLSPYYLHLSVLDKSTYKVTNYPKVQVMLNDVAVNGRYTQFNFCKANTTLSSGATPVTYVIGPQGVSGPTGATGPTGTLGSNTGFTTTGDATVTGTFHAGTVTVAAIVPTNITPGTAPVCANGTGGALTATGCTSGGGSTTLTHWRSALQAVKSGTANARVCYIGDSTVAGYLDAPTGTNYTPYSFPAVVAQDLVTSYGIPATWDSWFGDGVTVEGVGAYDSRFLKGSSWSRDLTVNSIGYSTFKATTSTNPIAFTPTGSVNTFKIYYARDSTQGAISVNIDGGTATVQNTAGTAAVGTLTVTSGTVGTHTLNIYWSSGGPVNIIGTEAWDSTTSHVIMELAGSSGENSTQAANTAKAYGGGNAAIYAAIGCDLTLLEGGPNEYAGANYSLFSANNQILVNAFLAAGSDVVIDTPVPGSTSGYTSVANQNAFVATMVATAKNNSNAGTPGQPLPLIDIYTAWKSYTAGNANNWYVDTIHPNATGQAINAKAVESAIANSPSQMQIVASPSNTAPSTSAQVLSTSIITTASATDTFTIAGLDPAGLCTLTPTNAGAIAAIQAGITSKQWNQITVTHAVTANLTYDVICALPATSATGSTTPAIAGATGYYPLHSSYSDFSGFGNNGVAGGTSNTFITDPVGTHVHGTVLSLSGSGWVGLPFSTTTSFTKSMWVYLSPSCTSNCNLFTNNSTSADSQTVLWVTSGFGTSTFSLQAACCLGSLAKVSDPAVFPYSTWVHVAQSYNGSTGLFSLYENGTLIATGTHTGIIAGSQLSIGAFGTGGVEMTGLVSQVYYFPSELTAGQIATLAAQK